MSAESFKDPNHCAGHTKIHINKEIFNNRRKEEPPAGMRRLCPVVLTCIVLVANRNIFSHACWPFVFLLLKSPFTMGLFDFFERQVFCNVFYAVGYLSALLLVAFVCRNMFIVM